MIQKLVQTSSFYSLSIGLHIAILFSLLVSFNYNTPLPPPVISASVYFETPKRVAPVRKAIKTKTVTVSKKPKSTSSIKKPKLNPIKPQDIPITNSASENLNLTSGNILNLKGFLRTNQLTKKQNPAIAHNGSSLINNQVKVKQKYRVNPLVKKPSKPQTIVGSDNNTEHDEYDDLLAELDVDESDNATLSAQWSKRTEKKLFRKSLTFQISEQWVLPPVSITDFEVIVEVLINKKGQIKKITFVKYASIAIINIAVERTLRKSEPFESVPESMIQANGDYKANFRFTSNQVAN